MGITTPQDRKAWVDDLHESLPTSGVSIISVARTVSNQGRYDDWMVGGAAAVFNTHTEGITRTWSRHWALGTEVTQYDVDLFGLAKAAQWAAEFYDSQEPPSHIFILSHSQAALMAITNICNTTNQKSVLLFHSSLTALCLHHREVGITLTWSPVEQTRVSDDLAWLKALQACRLTPLASLNRVQSAAHQKCLARKRAFTRWAKEWEEERWKRCTGVWQDSFAYEHALPFPPDGNNHPLWMVSQKTTYPDCLHKPSRHTTSTALHLAMGHTFTLDYSHRFQPDIPETDLGCKCSHQDRSWLHLVYECPRFEAAHHAVAPHERWTNISPHELMADRDGARQFIGYLTTSRAVFKPQDELTTPFDPGGPPTLDPAHTAP